MTEEVMEWIRAENLIEEGDCVIAGVSGGADSVCLLRLLLEIQKKMNFTLRVVHVEHGIRGKESKEDAAFVQALCDRFHVPCHIYAVDVPSYANASGLGLEEAARIKRYECYEKEIGQIKKKNAAVKVALAHHGDDNAETLLFQMIRGSGIDGLAGMRAKRPLTEGAEIIRPLLNAERREIESYLSSIGQEYRKDSTNEDTDYSRNRIRHKVLPELLKVNEQAVSHMNRSAKLLRQTADYLKQQTKEAIKECCDLEVRDCQENLCESGEQRQKRMGERVLIATKKFLDYPELIQNEVLHSLLAEVSGSSRDIGAVHVDAVRLLFQRQVGRSVDLPYGVQAKRVYEGVCLMGKQQRFSCEEAGENMRRLQNEKDSREITQGTAESIGQGYRLMGQELRQLEDGEEICISLPEGDLHFRILDSAGENGQIHKKKYTKWLNYDKIKGDLQIRRRSPGDYLTVDLQGHKKKLKEYFVNEKIPQECREHIWLLTEGAHVLWVIGGRISTDYKIDQQTKKILEVQMVGGNCHED